MSETMRVSVATGKSVHIKKKFPLTSLSRLGKAAPGILRQVQDLVTSPGRRVKDGASPKEVMQEMGEKQSEAVETLIFADLAELDALHTFCAEITHRVEGFKDFEGEPFVWKDKTPEDRVDLYDCDIPNATKISIVYFACLLKAGLDPEKLLSIGQELKEKSDG